MSNVPVQVVIVLGSDSDAEIVVESGMLDIFDELNITYLICVISAHRNADELHAFMKSSRAICFNTVYIAIAGMAAHLAGVVASLTHNCGIVIGVPLPSRLDPKAETALGSMVDMPPGCPVAVPGRGKAGLVNATLLAANIIGHGQTESASKVWSNFAAHMNNRRQTKPARIDVDLRKLVEEKKRKGDRL